MPSMGGKPPSRAIDSYKAAAVTTQIMKQSGVAPAWREISTCAEHPMRRCSAAFVHPCAALQCLHPARLSTISTFENDIVETAVDAMCVGCM